MRPLAILIVLCASATAAFAQTSQGPFGGLFGRTPERNGREFTAIEFRTSGGGQYDDGLFLDDQVDPADGTKGGYTSGFNAALGAAMQTTKTQLNTFANVGYQEYFAPRSFGATAFEGDLNLSRRLTSRVDLKTTGRFARQPFFQALPEYLNQSPDWMVPVMGNRFAARLLLNDTAEGQLGFAYKPTKRTTFTAYGAGRQVRFLQEPINNFDMVGGQGGISHRLSRDLGFHVGYGRENYRTNQYNAPRYTHEYLDIGLDFDRDISIARRTTIGVATQTSVLREADGPRRYRLNGQAVITRWFQRTWHASLGAQRSTDFVPGLFKPLFSDVANASLGGMISKRSDWFVMGAGGVGRFGFDPAAPKFITATATSRLNIGITRRLGGYVQYSFYHYELPPNTAGVALLDRLSRHSVVVGFNVWVPIYQEARAPRGPQ